MMPLVLVLLGYVLVVFIDTIPVYKGGTRKEFWLSTGILAVCLICSILLSVGIQLPSPAIPLAEFITKIYGL